MTRLIVNADDLGQSASINRGLVEAHASGILTSATWLAGGDAADAAVDRVSAHPDLEVGLHLALSTVRPVGDPAPFRSVLDAEGRWPSRYPSVVRWLLTTPGARQAVAAEWQAQIARFWDRWGRPPSHLDSHQHIALLPMLQELYVRLAAHNGIAAVRVPREVRQRADLGGPMAAHRPHETVVLSALAVRLARRAAAHRIAITDSFAGFRQSGCLTEAALLDLIPHLAHRGGTVELMTHPGDADEAGPGGTPTGYLRRQERDALTSPRVREALIAHGITLARFSDLSARR